jgi:glycosyltransferase involved in cell wall biosynthesis
MGYVFSSRSIFAKALMPIYHLLQRAAKPYASATIFQNGTDMSHFLARGLVEESKAVLIRTSGIDIEDFTSKIPPQQDLQELRMSLGLENKLVVTVVSRLTKQKGIPTFLEACKILTKSNQNTVFLLVGGVEEEGFQAVPRKTLLEQEPHVKLLGHRTDVAAILKITDVFVLPTEYREGVPRVLLEAGVMGCPMITTNMPGCTDVVRDGWNGIVVKPSCPEELARAIQVLLQNREMRAEFGSRSMAYIREHFAMDNIVDLHVDLYEKLLRVERRNQCARTLIPQ